MRMEDRADNDVIHSALNLAKGSQLWMGLVDGPEQTQALPGSHRRQGTSLPSTLCAGCWEHIP